MISHNQETGIRAAIFPILDDEFEKFYTIVMFQL